jgi:(2R)-3-sulfolactate dehydrogenase (NADP+)
MDTVRLTLDEAFELARRACVAAGAQDAMARSLAEATVSAEACGRTSVGFAHLPDYIAALKAGRIKGDAEPALSFPAPCLIACDVRGGIAQLGFDMARWFWFSRALQSWPPVPNRLLGCPALG